MRSWSLLVVVSLLCGFGLGANVLVAMGEGMAEYYWYPGETPFADHDLTGSTFTTVIDVDYDSSSILQNPIDPSFDIIIVCSYQTYYTYSSVTTQVLEDFANLGKVVLFAQPDFIFFFEIGILGANNYADIYSTSALMTPADVDPNFASDAMCDPLLNGPYGNLVGAPVDFAGMSFFGEDFDALELIGNGNGFSCLGLSAAFAASYGSSGPLSFLNGRPMSNGGYIAYLPLPYTLFDLLGQGWYSQVYNNILNFAGLGSVGGDPHIAGFDHSELELLGQVGDVFNMITDTDLQVNARLVTPELTKFIFNSFVGAVGFSTAAGETLIIDAGDETTAAFIDLNGNRIEPSALKGADMRSLSIRPADVTRVPSMKNVDVSWHTVDTAFVVDFERYTFEVFVISVNGAALRFLDFTVSPRGTGHSPHGVLGRTLNKSLERNVAQFGATEDFLVHDGVLGTDFVFNHFRL